jgi:hypothetical protein
MAWAYVYGLIGFVTGYPELYHLLRRFETHPLHLADELQLRLIAAQCIVCDGLIISFHLPDRNERK